MNNLSRFGHGWDQLTTASVLTLGWYEFLKWERQQGVYLEDSMLMRGDWLAKSTVIAIRWKFIAQEQGSFNLMAAVNDDELSEI